MTDLGAFGESWAAAYLQRRGYRIVERNVRFRAGEIDLVARQGGELVFIEVKCRRSSRFGSPEAAVDRRRFARLASAVAAYVQERGCDDQQYRVDVVAIEVDSRGRVSRCDVVVGAEAPPE